MSTCRKRLALAGPALLLVLWLAAPGQARAGPDEVWVAVDTVALTVSVMRGDNLLARYDNIAIGSNGPTLNKRLGDEKTPLGDFTITEIRSSDRFRLFLSIDYPNLARARRALDTGLISQQDFQALRRARDRGEPLPQDTALGGHLGIHGIGDASREIHDNFNWTDGCIAMTNEQVEALAAQVGVGTRVSIHRPDP